MAVKTGIALVSKAKAGDRYAFDKVVGPLVAQWFRLASGMLNDRGAAEEEAAVRSWKKLGNLRAGTELRPWFLAICQPGGLVPFLQRRPQVSPSPVGKTSRRALWRADVVRAARSRMKSEVFRSMTGIMRSRVRVVAVATTILALSALALALAPTALAFSPRSGALHVTKECSQDTGLADSFCTITSSNLSAIAIGSRVVYFQDTTIATISDIAVVVGPGNLALGHVNLVGAGPGVVTLSGGTGRFAQFHARAVVSSTDPNGIVWHWDGTYRFGGGD